MNQRVNFGPLFYLVVELEYKVGDFINYNNNILRLDKIDIKYYNFTIIKNVDLFWFSIDGLHLFPINDFYNHPLITDEQKLELL